MTAAHLVNLKSPHPYSNEEAARGSQCSRNSPRAFTAENDSSLSPSSALMIVAGAKIR